MNKIARINTKFNGGRFKIQVLDSKTKEIIEERPWQKNLILDQGLNMYGENALADCWRYCSIGTSNTPTVLDSNLTTATQSGTTVTTSAAFFVAGDVGRLFRFDSGEESYITSFTNSIVVEVADSRTVGSPTLFAVWRVEQTKLGAYTKRSSTYFGGSSYNGSTLSNGVLTMKRGWEFSVESGSITYREIGVHKDNATDPDLFARILIDGGEISLIAGQQLLVTYELVVEIIPNSYLTPSSGNMAITGWPSGGASTTDGDFVISSLDYSAPSSLAFPGTSYYYRDGVEAGGSIGSRVAVEPSGSIDDVYYSETATALPSYPISFDLQGMTEIVGANVAAKPTYIAGTFTRTQSITISSGDLTSSSIRRLAIETQSRLNWMFLFDENQEKLGTHELILTWIWSWSRDISSNP